MVVRDFGVLGMELSSARMGRSGTHSQFMNVLRLSYEVDRECCHLCPRSGCTQVGGSEGGNGTVLRIGARKHSAPLSLP